MGGTGHQQRDGALPGPRPYVQQDVESGAVEEADAAQVDVEAIGRAAQTVLQDVPQRGGADQIDLAETAARMRPAVSVSRTTTPS